MQLQWVGRDAYDSSYSHPQGLMNDMRHVCQVVIGWECGPRNGWTASQWPVMLFIQRAYNYWRPSRNPSHDWFGAILLALGKTHVCERFKRPHLIDLRHKSISQLRSGWLRGGKFAGGSTKCRACNPRTIPIYSEFLPRHGYSFRGLCHSICYGT